jgi:hypothetical protein
VLDLYSQGHESPLVLAAGAALIEGEFVHSGNVSGEIAVETGAGG